MKTVEKVERRLPQMTKRKRVAAYARVSMETERLAHSLSAQVSFYSDLIQSNPEWEYAGVYADSFISATSTKNRVEFLRLIQDCEEGKIDIVLCKSISRFARNTVDLLETVRHLKDIGVEVRFEKERINSLSGDGELMLSILASFAQEESYSLSQNCKWGIRKRFEAGQMRCSKMFGYRKVNGQLVVVPAEAKVVQRIFELYLNGMTSYQIANQLKAEGVKTYYDKDFYCEAILTILRNEKYTGNALLQKYYCPKPGHMVKNNGELPMYYSEESHPAIISQELFEAVQKEMARRYGVEIVNGTATTANYFYLRGSDIPREDYRKPLEEWTSEDMQRHANIHSSRATRQYLRYDLSTFLKCAGCGESLATKKRVYVDGTPVLLWECHKHVMRIKKLGINEAVPRPIRMKDERLKVLIAEVLGLEHFDLDIMAERLSFISAAGDMLTFYFRDGHTETHQYIRGKRRYAGRRSKCQEK